MKAYRDPKALAKRIGDPLVRPIAFLNCLGKAVLKRAAKMAGFGLAEVAEDVWNDWNKDKDEAQRRAELQAIVQIAAREVRAQVVAVIREVAAGQEAMVQRRLSEYLQQVPLVLRSSFRRPKDQIIDLFMPRIWRAGLGDRSVVQRLGGETQ